ncbi:hypothetical protein fh0823_00190 [Francisella halioticida]|uniref:Gamma-glutamylcyclotransferase n=1 Tax=Francisella halioticida TaxID=549298 RepID=A0ABN5AZ37_9GAMM|nr:gamma-glutamylcyclotransferase [Francisella halioticida]ASG67432.1 hypothetical protein CDV26_02585 [Francisella halioticida]BCD89880.1 hypothetical protein fh0823_00190 [Francisella halioticida]
MKSDFKKLITAKIQEVNDKGIKTRNYEQIEECYQQTLSEIAKTNDLYLFAYGSLIWKCDIKVKSSILSKINEFSRSFCINLDGFRGSKKRPGLMMAVEEKDSNAVCYGKIYRISMIYPVNLGQFTTSFSIIYSN